MNVGFIMCASALTVSVSLPYREPLDCARIAEAIAQAENTDNNKIGAAGERSRWQITPEVWRKWSAAPFQWASSSSATARAETYRVVRRQIDSLRVQLAIAGLPDTPFFCALAWTAGATAAINTTASTAKRDYARRAANLYELR